MHTSFSLIWTTAHNAFPQLKRSATPLPDVLITDLFIESNYLEINKSNKPHIYTTYTHQSYVINCYIMCKVCLLYTSDAADE